MKIIDAHLHIFKENDPWANPIATRCGNTLAASFLAEECNKTNIVHGIVMGNDDPTADAYQFDPMFHYCVGLDSALIEKYGRANMPLMVEEHLRRPACCGLKIYPGYDSSYVNDAIYQPYYELAQLYSKPVAIHTGQTQGSDTYLKYCHPMTLDELATDHKGVDFIMCHFGNPFLPDAAAVLEKNENVYADISGILGGVEDLDRYFKQKSGYIDMLRGWLAYGDYWDKIIFGTDYPGINMQNYIDFTLRLLPEEVHQKVMFDNANRIYNLGL